MTQPTVLSFLTAAKRVAFAFLLPTLAFAQYSSPVRDVENPAHSPLRLQYTVIVPDGAFSWSNVAAQVPFGKRMVVEYISVTCQTLASQGVDVVTLDFYAFDSIDLKALVPYALPVTKSPTSADGVNRYFASQRVQLYADGDKLVNMGGAVALTGAAIGPLTCTFVVSGHTVTLP